MNVLAVALECAGRGWAVFPVGNDKAPRCPRGHKAASTDAARIKAMQAQFGFVLVGIATGEASNLAVLDIDRQHDGGAWWESNRHRLPATLTHRTRSGGLHLWFQDRPGLQRSVSRIAPGVDVLAGSGAVIYWPGAGLPVLSHAPLAAWPDWLISPAKPPPAPSYRPVGARPTVHIEAQLAGLIRTIAAAPSGQRNATLFWASCRAADLVRNGELSKPHADAVLIEAARRAGLDELESARTIASAFTRRAG